MYFSAIFLVFIENVGFELSFSATCVRLRDVCHTTQTLSVNLI